MPIKINGEVYYTTSEICEEAGISRPTLFRWLRLGMFEEIRKNSRGWRVFTEDELNKVKAQTRRIEVQKYNGLVTQQEGIK